ncbi:amidohydrolase family protein [Microbacterium sp. A196]|uniref:amidohydrolase family protein n=1 Tax=unclassified Microbacterium TaxID=2609290 RepID=UPI003F2D0B15
MDGIRLGDLMSGTMVTHPRMISGLDWRGSAIDVHIADGVIVAVSPSSAPPPRRTLLPALHDHHVHLYAAAARRRSIDASGCRSREDFTAMLRAAATRGEPLRVVGYDDTVVGPLDRSFLDELLGARIPVRVQHRGGHLWVLSSAACRALESTVEVPADGRFWDQDATLATSTTTSAEALSSVIARLHSRGVVSTDDMTPTLSHIDAETLRSLVGSDLALTVFGANSDPARAHAAADGVKIVLADHEVPLPETITAAVAAARPAAVALHCVTADTMAMLLAAADVLQARDRIEHAFVAAAEVTLLWAARHADAPAIGVHPGFLRTHGDRLRRHGVASDVANYLRVRSWADAGLTLLGGTDLPFSTDDPWTAMQAAVDRRTASGVILGEDEAISPEDAFTLFRRGGWNGTAPRLDLGPGDPADLCIIDGTWTDARRDLSRVDVLATFRDGRDVFGSA